MACRIGIIHATPTNSPSASTAGAPTARAGDLLFDRLAQQAVAVGQNGTIRSLPPAHRAEGGTPVKGLPICRNRGAMFPWEVLHQLRRACFRQCPSCGNDRPPGARFAPTRSAPNGTRRPAAAPRTASGRTSALRRGQAERRQLTVMFVDLVGSTALVGAARSRGHARGDPRVPGRLRRGGQRAARATSPSSWATACSPISAGRRRTRTTPSGRSAAGSRWSRRSAGWRPPAARRWRRGSASRPGWSWSAI